MQAPRTFLMIFLVSKNLTIFFIPRWPVRVTMLVTTCFSVDAAFTLRG